MSACEQEAWQVVERLEAAGHEAYLVGGCVRDRVLGRPVVDYDITTSALPEQVQALFEHTVPTGIQHGTVTVLMEQDQYEVTTFRTEGKYQDGRRPEEVVFVRSLREDLARRDFTFNAMALGRDGTLHDPFQGREDLEKGVIRAVGDPRKRFEEDALRMLRAIRFAAQLQFSIEEETLAAIHYEGQALRQISRERIRDEWRKMLLASPDIAIRLLLATDTMRYVIARPPTFDVRVTDPWGLGVNPWQLAGEWAARAPQDLALRQAIVLTAIRLDEPRVDKLLPDLKLSTQMKKEIRQALLFYKFGDPGAWRDNEWRQRFFEYGAEAVLRGCLLYAAIHAPERMEALRSEVAARQAVQPLWSLQDLAVTGQDLIAAGLPAGPVIGQVQKRLVQVVLNEPGRNQKDELLKLALSWQEK